MTARRRLTLTVGIAALAAAYLAPQAGATFSGRNGVIAFVADTGDGDQIYTVRPNGDDLRQITHVDGGAIRPDWSPDGSRIAFAHSECNVALIDADGSNMTVLPSQTPDGCETDPAFTPDGTQLVYERYDPSVDEDAVWIMDVDGSDRRPVTSAGAVDPNVSPDGERVSFAAGPEDAMALFTVTLDGSDLFQLTAPLGVAFKHDWSPDGHRLVYTDNANDLSRPANVATIRPGGSGLLYLTDYRAPSQRAFVGSYSPDGQWIVFRYEDGDSSGLYRMRPTGGAVHAIVRPSELRTRMIDWGAR